MFELIRANKRKSMVLVFAMLLLLLVLGFVIGMALFPYTQGQVEGRPLFSPLGGLIGMGVAFLIWALQSAVAYFSGDRIMLAVSGAREIEKRDAPQLFNVVEEMTIAAALPKMPRVYIIDDMSMNAFATGRKPENAAVAVTAGLLGKMNRDQLQGVMAHEIGHIVNRDVQFMTMIGVMVGSILMISDLYLRAMFYSSLGSGRRYRSSSDRKGGGAQAALMILALVLAIVAPLLAQLIYFACSRRREYLADASAAIYTRYPEGLASALEMLGHETRPLQRVNRATAPMYISAPPKTEGMALNLGGTHPPIDERVRILRGMAGGVSYQAYQKAWAKVGGSEAAAMPASAMAVGGVAARKAHPSAKQKKQERKDARQRMRQAGDLMRSAHNFIFLACVCGMKLKLPPEFKKDHVGCPRCKRRIEVPIAQLATVAAIGDAMDGGLGDQAGIAAAKPRTTAEAPLVVTHKGQGWMSFKCSCGAVKNLAPTFDLPQTKCGKCGRAIEVKYKSR